MHPVELSPELTERLIRRRGRLHVFDRLDPGKTALIVIDMQNAFVAEGAVNEVPVAREIVPNINRLAEAMRQAGGLVIWVWTAFAGGESAGWPFFFEHMVQGEFGERLAESLSEGSEGCEFWPGLDMHPEDLRVRKNRFSAFIQGASQLEAILREKGIDTVLITGTVTNVCCESSGRDAMMRDFKAVLVSDGNAARSDEEHLASLSSFIQVFGDVRSCGELMEMLKATPLPVSRP